MATTLTPSPRTETIEAPAQSAAQRTGFDLDVDRSLEVVEPVPSTPRPLMSSWWSDLLRRTSSDFLSPRDAVLFTADPLKTVRAIQR